MKKSGSTIKFNMPLSCEPIWRADVNMEAMAQRYRSTICQINTKRYVQVNQTLISKRCGKHFTWEGFFFVILNPCWLTRVHKRMSLLCSILAEFSFTAKSCLILLPSQEYFHCIAPRNHILKVKRSWSNVCSTRRLVREQTSLSA